MNGFVFWNELSRAQKKKTIQRNAKIPAGFFTEVLLCRQTAIRYTLPMKTDIRLIKEAST
jgi:hypothetical protein